METNSSETSPGAEYGVARRLLATLEVVTVALVALALLVHALRKRVLDARARTQMILKGSIVLITSDTSYSRELSREFKERGCTVARLVPNSTLQQNPATHTMERVSSTIKFDCTCSTKADTHALAAEVLARLGQPIDVLAIVNDDDVRSSDGLGEMNELVNKQLMRTCYLLDSFVPLMRSGGRVLSVAREEGGRDEGGGSSNFARTRRSFAELLHTLTHQIVDRRGDIGVTSARLLSGAGGRAGEHAVRALCAGERDITIPTARQHYTFRIKDAVRRIQHTTYKAVWRRRKIVA